MSRLTLPALALAAALMAFGLGGCATTPEGDDGVLRIVATTNVYGDISRQIAGEHAEITSFITKAAQDPHSYEASARDQLAIADADVVIRNGGGYDSFVDTLLDASGNDDVGLLDAVEISGLAAADNEHVWYSFEAMDAVASELAQQLGGLDPANTASYQANYAEFVAGLGILQQRVIDLHDGFAGTGVAITEPVPLYLLTDLGFENKTPAEFSEAIEEAGDVSPLVLDETLQLFATDEVGLLAYNDQTASAATEEVLEAAAAAGIPTVSFTETLPEGATYLSWMTDNLDAVATALS